MERSSLQHLTPDEIDLVLEGTTPSHFACTSTAASTAPRCCRVRSSWCSGWRRSRCTCPRPSFEDRVMARVQVVTPRTALATCVTAHSRHPRRAHRSGRRHQCARFARRQRHLVPRAPRVLASLGMTAFRSIAELRLGRCATGNNHRRARARRAATRARWALPSSSTTPTWRRRGQRECC